MNSPWFDSDEVREPSPLPPRAPDWTRRDLAVGVALVLAGFVAVVVLVTAVAALGDPTTDPVAAFGVSAITLLFSAWLGVVVLLLARRRGLSLADVGLGPLWRVSWWWPLATWVGGMLIITAYAIAVTVVEQVTGDDLSRLVEGNPLPDTEAMTAPVWAVLGVAVIIAAPFGEELFFRSLVFRVVRARWGLIAGMAISGALFALVHFEVSVVLPFWGIGMLFAWSYHKSGTLWTPVIAHAIFNGVSFAATLAGVTS